MIAIVEDLPQALGPGGERDGAIETLRGGRLECPHAFPQGLVIIRFDDQVQVIALDADVECARQAWLKRKEVANLKLQRATRGESPIGDDGGRHAESESCVIVKK